MFAAKIIVIMNKIFTMMASISLATSLHAQVVQDSTVTGPSYTNDVFYSLPNSTVRTEPRDNWDLGFEVNGQTASVLVNTQGNTRVYQTPYAIADWASVDTAGMTAWQRLDNSPENWSAGALNTNKGAAGGFDLGWGMYDLNGANGPAHAINGDSIFVIRLNSGVKKFKVNRLFGGQYSFTWADLNGQNEFTDTVSNANYAGKNFGYYSLSNNVALDREPLASDWDLLFTRYITYDYSFAVGDPQSVTGVLLNKNTKAVKISGVHDNDLVWENYLDSFKTQKNVLGHNWKAVNLSPPPTWHIEDSLTFLVRRATNGEIWKVVFTGFGGSGSGKYFFNKELLLAAPTASLTSSNLSICAGDTVTFSANVGNGYTYQWFRGNTSIGGATAATLQVTQAGSYSVRVTDRGAFNQSVALVVSVNSLPVAAQGNVENPTCASGTNGSVAVNATGGTGSYTYAWVGTTATTAAVQNLGAGNYAVVVTDSLGCAAESLSFTLTEPAVLSATAAATGNSATATPAGGTAPYTYLWSDAGAQTTATATGLANDLYTVVVTDNNGCTTSTTVNVQVSSIGELGNALRIAIHPNPSNGVFTLTAPEVTDLQLHIADVMGRVVYSTVAHNTALNKTLDLRNLNAGVYLLNAQTPSGRVAERIIIR
jgi:hypothetical protein